MLKRLLLSLALILVPTIALACPDWRQEPTASYLRYSGSDLWQPKAHSVVAGGDQYLNNCGIYHQSSGERAIGYVAYRPDFELQYTGGNYQLEFRAVGNCDTVLLINTGGGNWYFDDDDGGAGDAKIRLTRPSTGVYDIWIGTYDPSTCNARLELESF